MLVLAANEFQSARIGDTEAEAHIFGHPEVPYDDDNILEASIRRFLMSTPNLSHLRLNFDRFEYLGFRLVRSCIDYTAKPESSGSRYVELFVHNVYVLLGPC